MSSAETFALPGSPAAISGAGASVRGAIAGAAQATGTDFAYLMAQARLESSLDPSARSSTSSASGLYQFTTGTWLRTLEKHGAEHGLAWASDMIRSGAASDPAARAQLLGLRFDPQVAATMAGELAGDNGDYLSGVLGRQPDHAELYLAHFFGAEGAGRFLTALGNDPSQSAATLLPSAAAANRSTFYDRSGSPRSVSDVMSLIRNRMAAASEGASGDEALQWAASMGVTPAASQATQYTGGPIAREFQSAAASSGNSVPVAASSMADTLKQAFALSDGASAPAHVRQAYGRLSAMGL